MSLRRERPGGGEDVDLRSAWIPLLLLTVAITFVAGCGGGSEADPASPSATGPALETGEPAPPDLAAGELLVVDLNILHGLLDEDLDAQPYDRIDERLAIIGEALAELQPQIIFLQEVVPDGDESYTGVRAPLLSALGDEYQAVFGAINGDDIGTLGQLTLTRLPILSSENHYVGGARAVHRVTVETDAGPIDLYNVHLEGTDDDPQLAIPEIENVLAFIDSTRTAGAPAILARHFNAQPDDPMIEAVLEAGFIDALAAAGDATCDGPGDPGCTSSTKPLGDNAESLSSRRIDYIFFQPGAALPLTARTASLFLNEPVDLGGGRLLWASDHTRAPAVLALD